MQIYMEKRKKNKTMGKRKHKHEGQQTHAHPHTQEHTPPQEHTQTSVLFYSARLNAFLIKAANALNAHKIK